MLYINKVFSGVYRGAIESMVYLFDTSGKIIAKPYFDQTLGTKLITTYFEDNLKYYVSDYQLTIKYVNHTTGVINDLKCDEIDIYHANIIPDEKI